MNTDLRIVPLAHSPLLYKEKNKSKGFALGLSGVLKKNKFGPNMKICLA